MGGPLSELDAKGEGRAQFLHRLVCSWYEHARRQSLHEHEFTLILIFMFKYVDVDSLLKKSEAQHESPEDGCPFGPLTQRLLQALVEVSTL